MSYMNHNAAFAPADGIQELSFDEVEQVDGALAPVAVAIVVVVAVVLVAFAVGVAVGYFAND